MGQIRVKVITREEKANSLNKATALNKAMAFIPVAFHLITVPPLGDLRVKNFLLIQLTM